jgi:hypothetical protein
MALLLVGAMVDARSPDNRDPFMIALLKPWNAKRGARPKKEARPSGPGTPYALRRNIVRNRQKTTASLAFG